MNEQKAAQEYAKVNVRTAGVLKSYLLLIDRALVLLSHPEFHTDPIRSRIQNILVQIQISLDLEYDLARQIHKGLAHLWDALETGNPALQEGISATLRTLRITIDELDRSS